MAKTTAQVKRAIRRYLAGLRRHVRIEKAILFGSYASGRPHEWSDIDLAIVSPDFDGMDLYQRVNVMAKARSYCDPAIESLAYGTRQYASAGRQTFLGEIKRVGKIVYDARRMSRRSKLRPLRTQPKPVKNSL